MRREVNFIPHQHLMNVVSLDFFEDFIHLINLIQAHIAGRIDHMQQHICMHRLFQRRAKCGNELMR